MSIDAYTSLCERIHNHCRQKQWYGPDIYYNQSTFNRRDRGGPWINHDFRMSFFLPATEKHLHMSEEVMGFSYPLLLRTLYLHVANGGFGPGYGLTGAFCGYRDAMYKDESHEYILQESVIQPQFPEGMTFMNIECYEKQYGDPKVADIGPNIWPSVWSKHFIHLCEWGCGRSSHLHAQNGRVYYQDEGRLFRQADSLEEWLERWLGGENLDQVGWVYFECDH